MDDVTSCGPDGLYRKIDNIGSVPFVRTGAETRDRTQGLRALIGDRTVVYAVQLADGIVKIGVTANLPGRLYHFRGAELLGFMFGNRDDETAIHRQLKPHRARGREYYHPRPEVLGVVNEMREALRMGLAPLPN